MGLELHREIPPLSKRELPWNKILLPLLQGDVGGGRIQELVDKVFKMIKVESRN